MITLILLKMYIVMVEYRSTIGSLPVSHNNIHVLWLRILKNTIIYETDIQMVWG